MLTLSRIVSSRIIANVSSWWVSTQIKHFCIVLVRHLQSTDKLSMCIKCQSDTLVSTFPALSTFTVAAVCSLKQCSECRSHLNLYAESRVRQFTFTSQQTSNGKKIKMVLIFFSIQFWSSAEKKSEKKIKSRWGDGPYLLANNNCVLPNNMNRLLEIPYYPK